ncbi:LuxR C-terminal-related transcriptional regulator [Lentibacillus kimchii]
MINLLNQESDMHAAGYAETVTDINAAEAEPDIILLDTEADNVPLQDRLHRRFPANKFLYLLPSADIGWIVRAVELGVTGLVLKDTEPERLPAIIRQFYDGRYVIAGEIAKALISSVHEKPYDEKERMQQLLQAKGIEVTNRDLTILQLLYHQKTNKEITAELGLAEKSVRDYVSTVYKHLNIHRRKDVYQFLTELMQKL